MSKPVTTQASFAQIELSYVYCSACGRKSYRLGDAGQVCQAFNSAPATYPQKPCPGTFVKSTAQIVPHDAHDERATS